MIVVPYKIKVPIYDYNIHLIITEDIKKYIIDNELAELEVGKTFKAMVIKTTYSLEYPYDWACVLSINHLQENIIVHEVFHLVAQILRALDTPLVDETEEVYAYLIEYLYKVIRHKSIEAKGVFNGNQNT